MGKDKEMNTEHKSGLLGNTLQGLRFAWREIVNVSTRGRSKSEFGIDAMRADIKACLEEEGGEVSARNRAAGLARSYLEFGAEDRLFFLKLLNDELAANDSAIKSAIVKLGEAESGGPLENARRELRRALEPGRVKLLKKFNTLQSGPRFLVELRSELIGMKKMHPELAPLEADLKDILRSWFDIGFLNLKVINWNSPASLLEKLGQYEAVHRVRGWMDLKNRLDIDRRCFAFFHPCMKDEPLIFIQVALVNGLAVQVQELLDEKATVLESDEADTAIFYSISNAQQGLVGISFGNFLIKQVVDQLRRELPQLKRFATLSPIPGFVSWLNRELEAGNVSLRSAELKKMRAIIKDDRKPLEVLAAAMKSTGWHHDEALSAAFKPILLRLCAGYLLEAKRSDGQRALNPVANFHISNGARMEQLNWMGDTSAKGMKESAGIMINYLYRLDKIDSYHEAYSGKGKIAASSVVKGLLGK
mgnify:CR=1 FL=1